MRRIRRERKKGKRNQKGTYANIFEEGKDKREGKRERRKRR